MLRHVVFIAVLAATPSISSAQQPCTTDARRVVNELYRHMLERNADDSSQAWVGKLQNGMTVKELVRQIATSQEHTQRFYNVNEGAVTNERAVANVYRHVLGRQPDERGLRSYTNMAASRGVRAVVDSMLASNEYQNNFGDWGVPGSGGLVFCAPNGTTSQNTNSSASQMRYADLDSNHDGMISRNEWRGTPRAFRIRDWNNDGVLSGDEVRVGATPPNASLEARDDTMSADDRFEYLDVNNNGFIDENEWDGNLRVFDRFDRNRDGRISRAELRAGRGTTFAAIDTDGDGRISIDEWQWSRRSFDQQDDNGDGVITRNEFRSGAVPTSGRNYGPR